MSYILEKSRQNERAALDLIAVERYASSVHCSFFSVLQLLLYILLVDLGVEDKTKSLEEVKYHKEVLGTSKHAMARTLVKKKITRTDFRLEFNDLFNDLSEFRANSDYYNIGINEELARLAARKTERVKHILLQESLI
ncbi:MAG TPA: hypothetical protein VMM58_08530 [Bacteroidota bacterium]|nr:hypothetical protein [Bacteroidota bacterium]